MDIARVTCQGSSPVNKTDLKLKSNIKQASSNNGPPVLTIEPFTTF